ncbi:hypothetical protein KAX17_06860 [Candidatus Bipolaricaulota bacterium]|nr:hypothetical protein [Candidatus Bipolaricaulota bacterium]
MKEPACNPRGINKTDWIRIDRAIYDACLDPHDYRKRKKRNETTEDAEKRRGI